jgi:hypothetical protein
MRFYVYQGITTVINSAYKNRGHAQMVATNLKQRRMYNLTMSCGRVLLDILRHFLNYEKIIIARMHAKGNDDVDNKTSDEMTKNGEHDLSIRFEAMVTKEVIDDVGL